MLKKMTCRLIAVILTLVLLVPMVTVPVSAATNFTTVKLTFDIGSAAYSVSVAGSRTNRTTPGTLKADNTSKTLQFSGSGTSSLANEIKLTITIPANTVLSFDYHDTVTGTLTKKTIEYSADGSSQGDQTINPVDGMRYSIRAGSAATKAYVKYYTDKGANNSFEASLENVTLSLSQDYSVTVNGAENGTLTVVDEVIEAGDSVEKSAATAEGLYLSASPASGYVFAGYSVNGRDLYIGSCATDVNKTIYQYIYFPEEDNTTITPVFVALTEQAFLVGDDTSGFKLVSDFGDAVDYAAANRSVYIIALTDSTIPAGDYTIPSGTTVVIPNDIANTVYTSSPNVLTETSASRPYVRLTAENGVNMTFADGAAMSIAGNLFAPGAGQSTRVTGYYGQLIVNDGAKVTFSSGAKLYAWGFATGAGEIECLSGAEAHEMFQINDFAGGTISLNLVTDGRAFPFSQYYVQNVECLLKINAGAKEIVYGSVHAGGTTMPAELAFIGDDTAMFTINDGCVIKYYDYVQDKLVCRIEGDAEINPITVSFAGQAIDSSAYQLPISNIGVEVGSGSTVAITQNLQILPDSYVTVENGAVLTINSEIYLIDDDDWEGGSHVYNRVNCRPLVYSATRYDVYGSGASSRTANGDVASASLDNNGTIIIDEGTLNTTPGGAIITSSEGTGSFNNINNYQGYNIVLLNYSSGSNEAENMVVEEAPKTQVVDLSVEGIEGEERTFYYDSDRGVWYITPVSVYFIKDGVTIASFEDVDYDTGITPPDATKANTAEQRYDFVGWRSSVDDALYHPEDITKAYENVTYTAEYTASASTYTVTWMNDDGTVLETDTNVVYGATPSYDGAAPEKAAAGGTTYTFTGWTPEVSAVTADVTYTAQFDQVEAATYYLVGSMNDWQRNDGYAFTFNNEAADGVEEYMLTVNLNINDQFKVQSNGNIWYPNGTDNNYTITSDGIYNIYFRPNGDGGSDWHYRVIFVENATTYTVTWKNADGSVLEIDEDVPHGTVPSFDGATPAKAADAQYTYTFDKWSPEVTPVTGDTTYTATYTSEVNKYTIKFVDEDGTELASYLVEYGTTPNYAGEIPTKAADAQYTYTFSGWTPEIVTVSGDATYTAAYSKTTNKYTITFKNEDGTVLQSSEVEYGTTPTYDGEIPTKAADAENTYYFDGWTPEITAVTADATYTAIYTNTVNTYTVVWKNEDGAELEKDENVAYGTTPSYDGETPTKEPDAQYTYTFSGWTPEIMTVSGDATYTAAYSKTTNKYTITFKNEDGTVLQSSEVEYGTTPTYDGATPTKAADAQYTYTFSGWTPEISDVTGDTTYTATYTSTLNKYTITFKNYDGTELQSREVEYGETPAYTGEIPTKAADAQYTYTFDKWSPGVTPVTGDTTYTATYTSEVNKYTIKFVDEDGTELASYLVEYGTTPNYAGATPTKASTAQYTYTFAGWDNEITEVIGDATYTATYSSAVNEYTIKFVNEDGTELQSSEVEYGTMPAYTGETPTKEATAQYTYIFAGWDNEIAAVTGEATYTATYTSTVNEYTIKFVNEDGTELQSSEVEYGTTPTYDGATPTKAADAQYTYTFSGWTPEISDVTGDTTYTATYTSTLNKYTITFKNYDGTELQSREVEYGETPAYTGETPTKAADAQYTYTFDKWSPEVTPVTGDTTYTATYTSEVNKYTIQFVDEDGTELASYLVEYGTTPNYAGEIPTKAADAQYTYTFAGWDNEITEVTGDATYTATYSSTVNEYSIKFVNEDGTELQSSEVEYGTMPTYDGATPTKVSTAQYTYTFSGWTPEISDVTGDTTYTATYTSTLNKYTITFKNEDGTVLQSSEVEYGTTPTYDGEIPTKAADAENTYYFDGWTPEITAVTTDATYTAIYTNTVNTYTVVWKNEDGAELEKDENVAYGTTPSYDGETPTKEPDAQYTYTFSGWTPEIVTVTGDATYTAAYSKTTNKYTITFKNEDGTVLQSSEVEYGTMPAYTGETPTKEATAQYTYTFAGWTQTVEMVRGDGTYTATYSSAVNEYTIKFVNEDGTELQSREVEYGETPAYTGETPTKAADAQYTYTFDKWTPEVTPVTGDTTYTATYTSEVNKYTIKFVDEDGTELASYLVEYGTTPNYAGATPTKASTAQYTYTFAGWDNEITEVTGDATYTVTYTSTVNEYTITFKNEDGTVLQSSEVEYGTTPTYDGATPTKAADTQYTYTFSGWTPEISDVTDDTTYTATYTSTLNKYTITFKNYDGTELQSTDVAYGEAPAYAGETPTKEATAQYTYTFAGWDNEIAAVTGEATYTATYTSTVNEYTITFKNEDGTVLQSTDVAYGEAPAYAGATPTKASTAQYTYTFAGWDNEIEEVTGDATYTATYSSAVNEYTIKFVNEDGTVLQSTDVAYGEIPAYAGETPTKEATAQHTYTFAGWDNEIAAVTGEATYTATYTSTVNEYTITFKNEDGTVLQSTDVAYGETPAYAGETPTKEATAQYTYTFAGWDNEIAAVTGEATYTATYNSTVNEYSIKFVNEDGTELQSSEVEYGATPVYNGAIPTKATDAQYTYTFSGWTPEISDVTGDTTYTATYTSALNKYTITFENEDGTVLQSSEVEYGITPSYEGETPVKPADEDHNYTFSGWTPEVVAVTGEATYTAAYTASERTFTVTWVNDDGTVLETDTDVIKGTIPTYDGATPTKDQDTRYGYLFNGWTPEVTAVTGDTTYKAVYLEYASPMRSLTLEGQILVNFYWALPEGENPADYTCKYTYMDETGEVALPADPATAPENVAGRYKIGFAVDAPEMTQTITAALYKGDAAILTTTFKAADYARFLTGWFNDEPLHPLAALVQATMNYGAKAQKNFGISTDDLADDYLEVKGNFAEVTQDMLNERLGDVTTKTIDKNVFADSGLRYYGASLVMNSNTKIKLYFDITNAEAFEAAKDSFGITDLDQNMSFKVDVEGNQAIFTIDGVAPANLEKRYVLTNGTASVDYAALDYVSTCLVYKDRVEGDNYKQLYDLTQALYWYNVYADAYFG